MKRVVKRGWEEAEATASGHPPKSFVAVEFAFGSASRVEKQIYLSQLKTTQGRRRHQRTSADVQSIEAWSRRRAGSVS